MHNSHTKKLAITICVLAAGGLLFYQRVQVVPVSFYANENAHRAVRTKDQTEQWRQKSRLLLESWHSRTQKDVTPRLLELSNDSDANIRERAVRLLGRLEAPDALPVLQQKLQTVERARTKPYVSGQGSYQDAPEYVPIEVLQLAIGRIESRPLQGRAKLDKMLEAVQFMSPSQHPKSLVWADVVEFSRRANVVQGEEHLRFGSPARRVFDEVVDVFHSEKQAGHDMTGLQRQLFLSEAQQMFLDTANLPLEEQIRRVTEFGLQIKNYGVEEARLITDYLLSLPPQIVRTEVNQKLADVLAHPQNYPTMSEVRFGNKYATGLLPIWNVVSVIGDEKTKVLLQEFVRNFDTPWIGGEATEALKHLNKKHGTILFPR